MSSNAVGFTAELIHDKDYAVYDIQDVTRAVEAQGVSMRYESMIALPTKSLTGDTFLDFETAGDRRWVGDDFVLYDGDYIDITADLSSGVDLENGRFSFAVEPTLPVTISARSYSPYSAAADLMLEKAGGEAGELQSFAMQNGSVGYGDVAQQLRNQAAAYRKRGRKVIAI